MDRRKVIIISHEFPPYIGGAGSVAETNAKLLSEENEVTVVTRWHPQRQISNLPYSVIQVKSLPVIFSFYYWFKIREILQRAEIEVIVINDTGAAQVASFFFSKKLLKKTVVYFHGDELEAIIDNKATLMKLFKRFYFNMILKAKRLIFVSQFLKGKILKRIDEQQALESKSLVSYNLVDTSLFFPEKTAVLDRFVSSNKTKIILTVTRLVAKKGLENVARVVKDLIHLHGQDVHWILVGSGAFEDEIRKVTIELGISERFTLLNNIKRSELRRYYSKADLFILLSEFEESFGLVYLEANACGIPSIGKNKGGVVEAIENGVNGFLVCTVEDAVARSLELLSNSEEASHYVKYVERFSVQNNRGILERMLKSN